MKHLKKILLLIIGLYVVTLGLVYVDVYDSRPIISLFKKIQTDSALEVVDFSVDKESVDKVKPAHLVVINNHKCHEEKYFAFK